MTFTVRKMKTGAIAKTLKKLQMDGDLMSTVMSGAAGNTGNKAKVTTMLGKVSRVRVILGEGEKVDKDKENALEDAVLKRDSAEEVGDAKREEAEAEDAFKRAEATVATQRATRTLATAQIRSMEGEQEGADALAVTETDLTTPAPDDAAAKEALKVAAAQRAAAQEKARAAEARAAETQNAAAKRSSVDAAEAEAVRVKAAAKVARFNKMVLEAGREMAAARKYHDARAEARAAQKAKRARRAARRARAASAIVERRSKEAAARDAGDAAHAGGECALCGCAVCCVWCVVCVAVVQPPAASYSLLQQ